MISVVFRPTMHNLTLKKNKASHEITGQDYEIQRKTKEQFQLKED